MTDQELWETIKALRARIIGLERENRELKEQNKRFDRLKSEYDRLKIHIENSEATCVICGDYFMPNVDSEETLYYCGNCREEA